MEKRASDGAAFQGAPQPSRRTPVAIAILAVAVMAVALLTKQPAPAASVSIASVAPRQPPAAIDSSPAPAVSTTSSPSSGAPSRNPTITPHPTRAAVAAHAGTTQLVPAGLTPVRLTISLPDGWQKASDAMYVKSRQAAPADLSIGAWSLQHVNTFPCRWAAGAFADGALMRTAEGQAEALSAWWGQDPGRLPYWNSKIAPLATKRQPAKIQGYAAWQLEVLIPGGLDLTECDGGQLILWDTATGDVRTSVPGELHRLWVVGVDGHLIVIDAASSLVTTSSDAAELQSVVDSIVIEP
jgi:hypothetical protein